MEADGPGSHDMSPASHISRAACHTGRVPRFGLCGESNGPSECTIATPEPKGHVPIDSCNSYNFNFRAAPVVMIAVLFVVFTEARIFQAAIFHEDKTSYIHGIS
ncbi:hypothetical protein F4776DRAFT_622905 [Hypoxylon sp. NC0597]|nr:hypothetical protein F4776DRAFT_622905 [Hypoxylon sp. NC0597]